MFCCTESDHIYRLTGLLLMEVGQLPPGRTRWHASRFASHELTNTSIETSIPPCVAPPLPYYLFGVDNLSIGSYPTRQEGAHHVQTAPQGTTDIATLRDDRPSRSGPTGFFDA